MLVIPKYIRDAGISSAEELHEWDEWNIRSYYMFEDGDQFTRLDGLTDKANTALVIASGEWVCERFRLLDRDPRPLQFLEASWAAVVNLAYCQFTVTEDDEWRGPVRGPLAMTMTIVNDALFGLEDNPDVAYRSCWMFNLARHVLPSTDAFDRWFETCVARLEVTHNSADDVPGEEEDDDPFTKVPWHGSPVPREAFDLSFQYQRELAPGLLDGFLRSLRPSENPYLRNAQEIGDLGGVGQTPFAYRVTETD